MKKIFIIGGTTYDQVVQLAAFPQPLPHTIHKAQMQEGIGSTGAGKAIPLTQLGVPTQLYSVVGNDVYGEYISNILKELGVHYFLDKDPAGTERHINLMEPNGGRISIFATQSSEILPLNFNDIQKAIKQAELIVINIIAYCKQIAPLLKDIGKPIWTDLHDYDGTNTYHQPFIDVADYIHLSSDLLPNYRARMQAFIAAGKKMVICTHGKLGATLLTANGEWLEQPAFMKLPQVDTNGAGDHFFAGFLFGWLKQYSHQKCLQLGALAAAKSVSSAQLFAADFNENWLETNWKTYFSNKKDSF
jgi:sugar/nucleoside kinase (ribokinase family)